MPNFKTFKELKELVENNGNLITVSIKSLRDAQGANKLGKFVIEGIQDSLAKQGLSTFPKELPLLQSECVRIYSNGTAVSKLFDAVTNIQNWDHLNDNYESDQFIRETINNDAQATLNKIKQLVCS